MKTHKMLKKMTRDSAAVCTAVFTGKHGFLLSFFFSTKFIVTATAMVSAAKIAKL